MGFEQFGCSEKKKNKILGNNHEEIDEDI